MTLWDSIYETAIDNYGLITTAQAVALGVKPAELPRWVRVKTGRLARRGHGVYPLAKYTPSDYDYYAEALAFTGETSSIFGESFLAIADARKQGLSDSNECALPNIASKYCATFFIKQHKLFCFTLQ